MVEIKTFKFDKNTLECIKTMEYGLTWPVVYIINNKNEAYVGETINLSIRANQHLANEVRQNLNEIHVITNEKFNKSTILDLESFLIKHMAADNHFKLQNANSGIQDHNYYQKEMYENTFLNIWDALKSKGIVKKDLRAIRNSDLFKYSPYKSLSVEQYLIVNDILNRLAKDIKNDKESLYLVDGGAGTGKTILGIYIMKLLATAINDKALFETEELEELIYDVAKIQSERKNLKIGLVIPMDNLRSSLRKCFREIKGLKANMVLSPNDVAKSNEVYDILIVDEAHRLRRRTNLANYHSFDINNKKLDLDKFGTELDWILKKSKYQIMFYDEKQSIRPTDVRASDFEQLPLKFNVHTYGLTTQHRCNLGGNEYIKYIYDIFSDTPPVKKQTFNKYDFKLFHDVKSMTDDIKNKDLEYGLSRNVAGYAWPWKTKNKKPKENENLFDITIHGHKYIWNTTSRDWINSSNSVNEIGSIHTTQGFDLNYTGLIIGNELKYDLKKEKFYIDKSNYYDNNGKKTATDDELLQYILNIYATMCTRGMLGTYLYVCDQGVREYLKRYIKFIN